MKLKGLSFTLFQFDDLAKGLKLTFYITIGKLDLLDMIIRFH